MDRFRERTDDDDPTLWSITDDRLTVGCTSDSLLQYPSNGSYVAIARTENMTDVVTPNFKRLSGQGQIINSPMTKTKVLTSNRPCSYMSDYEWEKWNTGCSPDAYTGYRRQTCHLDVPSTNFLDLGDMATVPEFSTTALIDRAVSQAWAAIGDESLLALVAVAESQKTVVSMVSIFKRLIKVIKLVKSAQFAKLRNEISLKELEKRYMEARYAIRPLIYDTVGIVNALTTTQPTKPVRHTFRGASTDHDGDTTYWDYEVRNTTTYGTYGHTENYRTTWARDIMVRAGVLTELEESSQLNIWGITQPIESAWELVPFSFLLEWFFNIGDVLGSWTPNYGFHNLASWYTITMIEYQQLSRTITNCYCDDTGAGTGYHAITELRVLNNCNYEVETTKVTRVPNPSRAGVPRLNVRLDALKLTDLLIIARKLWLRDNLRGGGLRY